MKISNGFSWTKKNDKRIQQEKVKVFISYSHVDWHYVNKIVETIEEYLNLKSILHDIWLGGCPRTHQNCHFDAQRRRLRRVAEREILLY